MFILCYEEQKELKEEVMLTLCTRQHEKETRKEKKRERETDGYWWRVRIERTEKIAEKGATARWRRVGVIYIHLIPGSFRVRESVWSPLWCLHLAKELLRESKREERGVCKHTANVQTWVHTRSDVYEPGSDKTRFISVLYLFSLRCSLFVYGNILDGKTEIDHGCVVSWLTIRRWSRRDSATNTNPIYRRGTTSRVFPDHTCFTFDTNFNPNQVKQIYEHCLYRGYHGDSTASQTVKEFVLMR